MNLSSSLEDYLEAMIDLFRYEGKIRVSDISTKLKVEKSSVNTAINKLKNLDLVTHEKYGDVSLTEKGKKIAEEVKEKHIMISKFLTDFLGLSEKEADKDACKIEHVLSDNTFERLLMFIKMMEESPFFDKIKWKESFNKYLDSIED